MQFVLIVAKNNNADAPSAENVGRPDQCYWLRWAEIDRVCRG